MVEWYDKLRKVLNIPDSKPTKFRFIYFCDQTIWIFNFHYEQPDLFGGGRQIHDTAVFLREAGNKKKYQKKN